MHCIFVAPGSSRFNGLQKSKLRAIFSLLMASMTFERVDAALHMRSGLGLVNYLTILVHQNGEHKTQKFYTRPFI